MTDYVPSYYSELIESNEILTRENEEIARLHATIDDLLPQFNVLTATWGLREWERVVGLKTNESYPLDHRRSNILARLRGYGTVTKAHIKNVSDSYYGGETEIIEKENAYTIVIKFTSSYGIPANLSDLQNVLREIIPAHLAIDYEFKFVLYDTLKNVYTNYDGILMKNLKYEQMITNGE